jgi:hypothetical protein
VIFDVIWYKRDVILRLPQEEEKGYHGGRDIHPWRSSIGSRYDDRGHDTSSTSSMVSCLLGSAL